jgi:hypothetical protein
MENVDQIKFACHKILSRQDLLPKGDITFCNIGFNLIMYELGYIDDFKTAGRYMMANEIYDKLTARYEKVEIGYVISNITSGNIFVACRKEIVHGHIAIVYPDKTLSYSGKWINAVPLVANIGKINGVIGLNWAFGDDMPDLFLIGKPKAG